MRTIVGFTISLLATGSVFAQGRVNYSNPTPYVTGGVGSAVFPAGTPQNYPGIQRFNSNVIHPAGGGPHLVVPNATNTVRNQYRRPGTGSGYVGNGYIYPYPVYVGGGSYYDPTVGGDPSQQPAPQQPNITIVMPPQQPPVIINQSDPVPHPVMSVYQPEATTRTGQVSVDETPAQPSHYLLAFKDHTVYSAIAYWVDGDTLHYFTAGNTHNQVSVSLVDRAVTERLNREAGVEVKLPRE